MSTENTTVTAPVIGTPEYDAAMAAKFDATQAPTTEAVPSPTTEADAPAKPDWLPEKFWKDGKADYAGLAESYKQLESGKAKPATAAEVPPEAAAVATKEDAAQALESVGLDYAAISARYQASGSLDPADRAALNKAGVPDGMIDAYVAGQQAQADAFLSSVYDSVGGQEKFTELVTWAKTGLSAAELTAYNKTVEGGDPAATKLAVAGLQARFEAANGVTPNLVTASTGAAVGGPVFRSTTELTTAMNDPRYKTDPAYRQDVIERLNRSDIM